MQNPTSTLLTAIAITDFLCSMEYIPYAIGSYIMQAGHRQPDPQKYASPFWAVMVFCHMLSASYLACVSVWLHVSLAYWRYMIIR